MLLEFTDAFGLQMNVVMRIFMPLLVFESGCRSVPCYGFHRTYMNARGLPGHALHVIFKQ